jgi:hypothetical protein
MTKGKGKAEVIDLKGLLASPRPILDSRTGFRHREWRKCWRLIKPGRKCGAKLLWGEVYIA